MLKQYLYLMFLVVLMANSGRMKLLQGTRIHICHMCRYDLSRDIDVFRQNFKSQKKTIRYKCCRDNDSDRN